MSNSTTVLELTVESGFSFHLMLSIVLFSFHLNLHYLAPVIISYVHLRNVCQPGLHRIPVPLFSKHMLTYQPPSTFYNCSTIIHLPCSLINSYTHHQPVHHSSDALRSYNRRFPVLNPSFSKHYCASIPDRYPSPCYDYLYLGHCSLCQPLLLLLCASPFPTTILLCTHRFRPGSATIPPPIY